MQERDHVPFAIDRTYWIYDVAGSHAGDESRDRPREEIIVALAGDLDVAVHDGAEERIVRLDRAYKGLLVPGMRSWSLRESSPNAIALVVASPPLDATDAKVAASIITSSGPVDARQSTIEDCAVVDLPRLDHPSTVTTSVRSGKDVDFQIRRVYYLTDIPHGAARGGHAHRELHQYVVAASGSFEVVIDDGLDSRSIRLARPDRALHLVPGIWRNLQDFADGSICLVIASRRFEESDYLRGYGEFLAYKRH
jgi:hypothetical protein